MKTIAILGAMFVSLGVLAESNGNGGGAHFCPGKTPAKNKAEMYDVYEGRKRYQLELSHQGKTVDEILAESLKKLKRINYTLGSVVENQLIFVQEPANLVIDSEFSLVPVKDANILMSQKGCYYKQVANWDEVSNKIFIDGSLFNLFSNESKAALFLHEAVYKVARLRMAQTNSDATRRLVGELLSESETFTDLDKWALLGDVKSSQEPVPFIDFIESKGDLGDTAIMINTNLGKVNLKEDNIEIKVTYSQLHNLEARKEIHIHEARLKVLRDMRKKKSVRKEISQLEDRISALGKVISEHAAFADGSRYAMSYSENDTFEYNFKYRDLSFVMPRHVRLVFTPSLRSEVKEISIASEVRVEIKLNGKKYLERSTVLENSGTLIFMPEIKFSTPTVFYN